MSENKEKKQYIRIRGANEHNLKNIDVQIPRDKLVVFTGLSGSGKSSLVNEILYKRLAAELNGAKKYAGAHKEMKGIENLDKVNMKHAADLKPYQLSGGMQQRVAIARALAMDTEILLFDEPFGALDIKTRRELQMLMQELRVNEEKSKTAVFVTHDIEEAMVLADRIIFMSDGRLLDEFEISAPRPRDPETFINSEEYQSVRESLMQLFYNSVESQREEPELPHVEEVLL